MDSNKDENDYPEEGVNFTTGDVNPKKVSNFVPKLEFQKSDSCRSIYSDESFNIDDDIEIF